MTRLHRIITERILLVIMIILFGDSGRIPHSLRVIIQEAALGTQLVVVVISNRVVLVANHIIIKSLMQLLDLVLFNL